MARRKKSRIDWWEVGIWIGYFVFLVFFGGLLFGFVIFAGAVIEGLNERQEVRDGCYLRAASDYCAGSNMTVDTVGGFFTTETFVCFEPERRGLVEYRFSPEERTRCNGVSS